jgi:HEPN domain-containing protein
MDKYDEVREWITYSDNDMTAVKQLSTFHPPQIEIICYLCQQSAEKVLKAFLVCSERRPPRTHDLRLLRDECEKFNARFLCLIDECARLNDYSSQPRYPSGLELVESDMDLAIQDSAKISEFVKGIIVFD